MNKMQKTVGALLSALSVSAVAAVPEISNVAISQGPSPAVTITYALANGPAVVTLDIETNCTTEAGTAWVSIGGENINTFTSGSDVFRKVTGDGPHTIKWRADRSWREHTVAEGNIRAVLKAWPLNNTPDYMVLDITEGAQPGTQRYYPSVEFLPGGIISNRIYRQSQLVMRKVRAKGIPWVMGSIAENGRDSTTEATHLVTLEEDYYLGVFPLTQRQARQLNYAYPHTFTFTNPAAEELRPLDGAKYSYLRSNAGSSNAAYEWPNDPHPDSILGVLRKRTGLEFDMPSEAEWEFACRAGHGEGEWGDGSMFSSTDSNLTDANLDRLGRYRMNGGYKDGQDAGTGVGPENGPAIVGSYDPNSWGFYDMYGSCYEWCLDWYEADISARNGVLNIDSNDNTKTLSGATGEYRVLRGNTYAFTAKSHRSAVRTGRKPGDGQPSAAYIATLRVRCPADLD